MHTDMYQVFLKVKALKKKSKAWSIIVRPGFSCEMCLAPLSCASPVLVSILTHCS